MLDVDDEPAGYDLLDDALAVAKAHADYERALNELGRASRELASLLAGRPLSTLEATAALRRRERTGRAR